MFRSWGTIGLSIFIKIEGGRGFSWATSRGMTHIKNRHCSRHFGTDLWRDFPNFFLTDFDASKSVLRSFFAFFAKIWPKNMYRSSKSRNFLFDLFHLVTWDDLDLYYDHKAQEMILTDVSDTIHADSLALFALNIEILLADVTKPEKSKILTLTWSVTSSVTFGSIFWPCTGSSRTGLSNGVWNLEIGPVVWEISGEALCPPPPQHPSGARVKLLAGRKISEMSCLRLDV